MYIYQPKTKQLAIQTSTLAPVANPEQNADVFIGEIDNKLNITINNAENVKINGKAVTPAGAALYIHRVQANAQYNDSDYPYYDYDFSFISADSEQITDVADLKAVIEGYMYLPAMCNFVDDGISNCGDALSIKSDAIYFRSLKVESDGTTVSAQWVDSNLEDSENYTVTITDSVIQLKDINEQEEA